MKTWEDDAACKGAPITLFFPEEPITSVKQWAEGKKFCANCTVQQQCLMLALNAETAGFRRYGLFGGMTPKERDTYHDLRWREP